MCPAPLPNDDTTSYFYTCLYLVAFWMWLSSPFSLYCRFDSKKWRYNLKEPKDSGDDKRIRWIVLTSRKQRLQCCHYLSYRFPYRHSPDYSRQEKGVYPASASALPCYSPPPFLLPHSTILRYEGVPQLPQSIPIHCLGCYRRYSTYENYLLRLPTKEFPLSLCWMDLVHSTGTVADQASYAAQRVEKLLMNVSHEKMKQTHIASGPFHHLRLKFRRLVGNRGVGSAMW